MSTAKNAVNLITEFLFERTTMHHPMCAELARSLVGDLAAHDMFVIDAAWVDHLVRQAREEST